MSKVLEDVLRQGLAGSRPAANAVVVGSYWFSTDTGILSQSDGSSWTTVATTTVGTVTSVALTVPAILSVAGSPITSSGTLAVTLATETANTVFSGPTTGAAATPTFRAMVAADHYASGVSAGTTSGITVDVGGHVTARTALVSGDLPAATSTAAGAVKAMAQFVATQIKTVSNTTTPTTLFGTGVGTLTLPVNCLTAGRVVRIRMRGYLKVASGVGCGNTWTFSLGGTALWAPVQDNSTVNQGDNLSWELEADITCFTTGAPGTVMMQGAVKTSIYADDNTSPIYQQASSKNTATTSVTTSGSLAVGVTITMDTADANNYVVCTNATVELLG